MWRSLGLLIFVMVITGCTVQPMTPTPVDVTMPPVAIAVSTFALAPKPSREGPRSAATGIVPTESAIGIASAIPTMAPSPTEAALAALVVNPTPVPAPTDVLATALLPTDIAPPSADTAAAEQYTIDLINVQRAAAGVPPLNRDETLMTIARARVADMVARGYTGHDDPVTGEHLGQAMMRAAGYVSTYLGENWYGSIQSPPTIVDTAMAWFMTDPPHANNILSPNYVRVGVGIAFNGQQWLLVQDFAGPNP